jgi:hypothetical protein
MTISSLAVGQLVPLDGRQAAVLAHLFDAPACLARFAARLRRLRLAGSRGRIHIRPADLRRGAVLRLQDPGGAGDRIVDRDDFTSPLASVTSWRVRPALSR